MATYKITLECETVLSVNGKRVKSEVTQSTQTVTDVSSFEDVANHINKMLAGIYNMNKITIQGVRYPRTMYAYKSNISDIYAIGYGFVTVTNIYSSEYIETVRYEFTAERIG